MKQNIKNIRTYISNDNFEDIEKKTEIYKFAIFRVSSFIFLDSYFIFSE